jgi:hypothetical protein
MCSHMIPDVEQRYELENLRRSLTMLTPGVPALSREEALALLSELSVTQRRLDRLRSGLQRLLNDDAA